MENKVDWTSLSQEFHIKLREGLDTKKLFSITLEMLRIYRRDLEKLINQLLGLSHTNISKMRDFTPEEIQDLLIQNLSIDYPIDPVIYQERLIQSFIKAEQRKIRRQIKPLDEQPTLINEPTIVYKSKQSSQNNLQAQLLKLWSFLSNNQKDLSLKDLFNSFQCHNPREKARLLVQLLTLQSQEKIRLKNGEKKNKIMIQITGRNESVSS